MATDIAFVVGCMAVLGKRVPHGLRVMLLSLAIADDIGAILVIAIGYTSDLSLPWLGAGFGGFGLILILSFIGVRSFLVYTIVGAAIWFAFHESGVHATIAGVILGLMTPTARIVGVEEARGFFDRVSNRLHGDDWNDEGEMVERVRDQCRVARETVSPLAFLIHVLHPWVSFLIMPVFALANAGVPIGQGYITEPISLAVIAGLFLGKPIGVTLASLLAVKLRVAQLPVGVTWLQVVGGGALAGIGFTMAIFIAGLAVNYPLLDQAKVGILAASVFSAVAGMVVLTIAHRQKPTADTTPLPSPAP
jgi:Na+:H+ antiporter, NhaA family